MHVDRQQFRRQGYLILRHVVLSKGFGVDEFVSSWAQSANGETRP